MTDKLLFAKVKLFDDTYSDYVPADLPNAKEILANSLYDAIYEDYQWGASVTLKEKNEEYYIHYEDSDYIENPDIIFEEREIPSPIRNINGIEVNMSEIHVPTDGSISEWHMFEEDMEKQMLPKDVKKIIRHEMEASLDEMIAERERG